MKIIRHSRKMFVYSLSLLLYAQQVLCMEQLSVLTVDTTRQSDIMSRIKALNSTNARIDMMQTMLGSIIKNAELKGTNVAQAEFENVPLDDITINNADAETTQQNLINMQKQVLQYKAQYLFSLSEWQKTRRNEINANTLSAAVAGFVLNKKQYRPNLAVITGGRSHLPENPRDLDAKDLITALKLALGNVPDNAIFLGKAVKAYKEDLQSDHTFFVELEASCCFVTPAQQEQALQSKIEWRTLAIPLTCFAQKQEILSRLNVIAASQSKAAAAAQQHPQSQFSSGQTLYGTMDQQSPAPSFTDKPHQLNQVADPFVVGSGLTLVQDNNR